MSDVDERIGRHLTHVRVSRGMTQEMVAIAMCSRGFAWSKGVVGIVERAQRPVLAAELAALVDLFKVPADVWLTTEPPPRTRTRRVRVW